MRNQRKTLRNLRVRDGTERTISGHFAVTKVVLYETSQQAKLNVKCLPLLSTKYLLGWATGD